MHGFIPRHLVLRKRLIATGIRRGECCGIKWSDIDYAGRSIHICLCRNVVKVGGEDICIK